MTALEVQLRVSVIQTELRQLGDRLDAEATYVAKVIEYAATVLNLVEDVAVTEADHRPSPQRPEPGPRPVVSERVATAPNAIG